MIKLLAVVIPLALLVIFVPAFAQLIEPRGTLKNGTENDLLMNSTGSELPVLEQTSEKGIYLVQLSWPQDPIAVSQEALQIEISFLNASAPRGTEENIPQTETNTTGQSQLGSSGYTDPSMIQSPLRVESYDITVYGEDGSELWKKEDQAGLGGRGTQRIEFEGNYTGPVTINITDIRPGWNEGGTSAAEDLTDSVSFTATVVPEFPIVAAILAGGLAAGIGIARLKRTRVMED